MARKRQVTYWASRGGYGCWIDGKQTILAKGEDDAPGGPTFTAALKRYKEILELKSVNHAGDANTVRAVLESFCRWASEHRAANTLGFKLKTYARFVEAFGERTVASLVRHEITQWLDHMRKEGWTDKLGRRQRWGSGQIRGAIASLSAAFKWAVREEICTRNPVAGIERPRGRSRGAKMVIADADYERILRRVQPHTGEYIKVLRLTGARPGEISNVRGEDVNLEVGAIIYPWSGNSAGFKPKTHRTEKDRVIFLAGEALDIVKQRMQRYGAGYLFLMTRRKGGKVADANKPRTGQEINGLFKKLAKRFGIPGLSAYSLRHTFMTRWLESERSIETLGELVGTSPEQIRKHYNHPEKYRPALKGRLEKFVAECFTAERIDTRPQAAERTAL